MAEENALSVAFQGFNLPVKDPDALTTTGEGTDFRKRLQFVASGGKLVTSGKVTPGNYVIPQDDEVDILGDKIVIIPLAMRDKAFDNNADPCIVNFEPDSDDFKRIKAAAKAKAGDGYMYGPSLLVYEASTGQFLEYFMKNVSERSEAERIKPFLPISQELAEAKGVRPQGPQVVTLGAKFIPAKKGKNYTYYVPKVKASTEIIDDPPAPKVFAEEIMKFYAEKSTEVEKVEEGSEGKRKR